MTIAEFLLARIAEDEAQARGFARHAPPDDSGGELLWPPREPSEYPPYPMGVLLIGLDRVLAECKAKRAIVAEHSPVDYSSFRSKSPNACHICGVYLGMDEWGYEEDTFPCATLTAVASVYADHSDFDPAWA